MIDSVLVANRGEIARRVLRAARAMGIRSIAVYSEADAGWPHVREADEAVAIGPAPARESYLSIEHILDAARRTGARAIHPGYGFLSENWRFAKACEEAGLVFVGPSWLVIQQMGDKVGARAHVQRAGVPIVPGSDGPVASLEEAARVASRIGYPLMLKAAAGGGGIGMVKVADESGLVVAALGGAPGIYSARWAGASKDFRTAMERVHRGLADQDRTAWFVAVLALAWPDGGLELFRGEVAGRLLWPPRGARGFGYDPMFVPEGGVATFGELDPAEKHKISHRACAFAKLAEGSFQGR